MYVTSILLVIRDNAHSTARVRREKIYSLNTSVSMSSVQLGFCRGTIALLTVLFVLSSTPQQAFAARVYKWINADGTVQFSDKRPPQNEAPSGVSEEHYSESSNVSTSDIPEMSMDGHKAAPETRATTAIDGTLEKDGEGPTQASTANGSGGGGSSSGGTAESGTEGAAGNSPSQPKSSDQAPATGDDSVIEVNEIRGVNGTPMHSAIQSSAAPVATTRGPASTHSPDAADSQGAATWMRGAWGIRFVLPGGRGLDAQRFDVDAIASQLSDVKTARWVMLNLTHPALGGLYTGPSAPLRSIDKDMVADRDLLGAALSRFRSENFRTFVYFAAQGPDMSFFKGGRLARFKSSQPSLFALLKRIEANWQSHLRKVDMTHEQAMVEDIIGPFALQYAESIDGWWFDHGETGDYESYRNAVKKGNPNALVAWNQFHEWIPQRKDDGDESFLWGVRKSHPTEDYTAGHITPPHWFAPWSKENDIVVERMLSKSRANEDEAVFHLFVPVQSDWRGGTKIFPLDRMLDWTRRITAAGGAITWAIALEAPEFSTSQLNRAALRSIKQLDALLLSAGLSALR